MTLSDKQKDFIHSHGYGSTQNPIYNRYEKLVVNHTARPVIRAMKHRLGIDPYTAFNDDQRAEFVRVRYLACYLLKKHTTMTLNQIALIVSGGDVRKYDHSTVSHGITAINNKLEIIGTNGHARPVCKQTTELIANIEKLIK